MERTLPSWVLLDMCRPGEPGYEWIQPSEIYEGASGYRFIRDKTNKGGSVGFSLDAVVFWVPRDYKEACGSQTQLCPIKWELVTRPDGMSAGDWRVVITYMEIARAS